jgi:hypothetical protein
MANAISAPWQKYQVSPESAVQVTAFAKARPAGCVLTGGGIHTIQE